MSILLNGVDVITPEKLTTSLVTGYSKGIRNTTSNVITGGGTDDVLSVYYGRISSTPEGYLDIGSSLVDLPIYIGATQTANTKLKIIKKGETVGLVPRTIIASSTSGTNMWNYVPVNHRPDVKKAIYVIQAPGGGGAGGGTWGLFDWDKDAGGGGGGAGGFAVFMTNNISENTLIVGSMLGGAGGENTNNGSHGSTITINRAGGTYLSVRGGQRGNFRDGIDGPALGGGSSVIVNNIANTGGTLIASHIGGKGGDTNVAGGSVVYTSSLIDGQINSNLYFGMKYGGSQETKAIARFYTSTSSYVSAANRPGGTRYGNDNISRGGSGGASLFSSGGPTVWNGLSSNGNAAYGAGGGGGSSWDAVEGRLPGGSGGNGMIAILY